MTYSMKPETKDRVFSSPLLLLILTMALWWFGTTADAKPALFEQAIQKAGNADDDTDRLKILQQLRKQDGLDQSIEKDLDQLIKQIDRWLHNPRLDYFGREVSRTKDYKFGLSENSPLEPLTWLYRGRMLTWYTLESGGVWNQQNRKAEFLGKAKRFYEKYAEVFPNNRIVKMYLGEPIPNPKLYEPVPGAPDWAIYQREGLERIADIIEWWIDNRMRENGEYGGGWGDDCEMWRFWVPILIGFDDPKISRAQARFSQALMSQSHMKLGYTTRMTDVEHTAEDSADVITPMMHLDPDNPIWKQRALKFAEFMEKLWTGKNERGLLQFKSTYFTAERVDTNPQRACDTVYHPRAVQPTLLYWQRTGDDKLTRLFSAWMDTWVDAAARNERGKPAGIIPSAIHWPDGRVGGAGPDWWDPRNHGEYTLYLYPSALDMLNHTLLLTHYMTGEEKYLEPIRSQARIRLNYLKNPPRQSPPPGSEAWCASRLGGITGVLTKYKFLTGSTKFDELLSREMSPYMRYRLRVETKSLVSSLQKNAQTLRMNYPGYTSEVRYTDRVLRFPTLFGGGLTEKPIPGIRSPNTSLLYSTATGDPGGAGYFPLNAVRWLTPPRNLAALVTMSGKKNFAAQLFHFGTKPRPMAAELYLLAPGAYEMTLSVIDNNKSKSITKNTITITGPRTRISFDLPAQKLCTLQIQSRK
jgi:hypothetical protein